MADISYRYMYVFSLWNLCVQSFLHIVYISVNMSESMTLNFLIYLHWWQTQQISLLPHYRDGEPILWEPTYLKHDGFANHIRISDMSHIFFYHLNRYRYKQYNGTPTPTLGKCNCSAALISNRAFCMVTLFEFSAIFCVVFCRRLNALTIIIGHLK